MKNAILLILFCFSFSPVHAVEPCSKEIQTHLETIYNYLTQDGNGLPTRSALKDYQIIMSQSYDEGKSTYHELHFVVYSRQEEAVPNEVPNRESIMISNTKDTRYKAGIVVDDESCKVLVFNANRSNES